MIGIFPQNNNTAKTLAEINSVTIQARSDLNFKLADLVFLTAKKHNIADIYKQTTLFLCFYHYN